MLAESGSADQIRPEVDATLQVVQHADYNHDGCDNLHPLMCPPSPNDGKEKTRTMTKNSSQKTCYTHGHGPLNACSSGGENAMTMIKFKKDLLHIYGHGHLRILSR